MFYHKPEKLYNYLKHTSSSHSIPQNVHHKSITYSTLPTKVEAFNTFFNSIFTQSNSTLPNEESLPAPVHHLGFITINTEDVIIALS